MHCLGTSTYDKKIVLELFRIQVHGYQSQALGMYLSTFIQGMYLKTGDRVHVANVYTTTRN